MKILILFSLFSLASLASVNKVYKVTVSQSSTLQTLGCPNNQCSASLANDGIATPNLTAGFCSSTTEEQDPWIMFTLAATTGIRTVVLRNREDCCSERLTNYRIFATNSSNYTEWDDETNRQDCQGQGYIYSSIGGGTYDCGSQIWGQYLVVQIISKSQYLSLCEVYAYEQANVIKGKSAYIYPGEDADYADGATDPNNLVIEAEAGFVSSKLYFYEDTCVGSKKGANNTDIPYWYVDMGSKKNISEVLIFNRDDANVNSLTPFQVRVGNSLNYYGNSMCTGRSISQANQPITCNLVGQYLYVILTKNDNLFMCGITAVGSPLPGQTDGGASNVVSNGTSSSIEEDKIFVPVFTVGSEYALSTDILETPGKDPNVTLNLVLGTAAVMSSVLNSSVCGGNCSGSLAVDGNPNPIFNAGSVATTNNDLNPFIYLHLNATSGVRTVVIINRNDDLGKSFQNYRIFTTNSSNYTLWDNDTQRQDCYEQGHIYNGLGGGIYDCRTQIFGQYLVIQILGEAILSLAEIYAFEQKDIANGKKVEVYPAVYRDLNYPKASNQNNLVTESPTGSGLIPVSSTFKDSTCIITTDGTSGRDYPYISIDLGRVELVSEALVFSRRDKNFFNMVPYQIRVGNSLRWQENAQCNNSMILAPDYAVRCNLQGRYVSIVNGQNLGLQVCGVSINGGYISGVYSGTSLDQVNNIGSIVQSSASTSQGSEYLTSAAILFNSTVDPTQSLNVLLGCPVVMSSILFNPVCGVFGNCSGSLAVDGNPNPYFSAGSVASTRNETDPYIRFDLNGTIGIRTVVLVNQIGQNASNLFNLSIFTTNTTESLEWKSNAKRQDCYNEGHVYSGIGGGSYDCKRQIYGTYLVVQIIGQSALSIAEAYAYVEKNVVVGKDALVYPDVYVNMSNSNAKKIVPEMLVTEDASGKLAMSQNYSVGTCIVTVQGKDGRDYPYYQVDLGKEEYISEVLVFTRRDMNFGYMLPFEVRLGNSQRWQENDLCNGTEIAVPDIPNRCNFKGRFVTVVNGQSWPLTICGITVTGGYTTDEYSATSLSGMGSEGLQTVGDYITQGSAVANSDDILKTSSLDPTLTLNVLLGQPVIMSSLLFNPYCGVFGNCSGSLAVDGNPNPNFTAGSVASTQYQRDPYMRFGLNGTKGIRTVVLINQNGNNSMNMQNLSIFVTNSTDPQQWKSNKIRQDCYEDGHVYAGIGGGVYDCRKQIYGNYLVVQIVGSSNLSIAEAYAFEQKDVLINKTAIVYPAIDMSQASKNTSANMLISYDSTGRIPISSTFSDGTCIITTQGSDGRDYPFYQVDLGREELISEVLVFTRRDLHFGYMIPYEVRVGNSVRWQDNDICNGTEILIPDITSRCNKKGRYVSVVNGQSWPLQICGLTVNGGYYSGEYSASSVETIGSAGLVESDQSYVSQGSAYAASQDITQVPKIDSNTSLNLLQGNPVLMSSILQDPACGPFLNCSGIRAVDGNANPYFSAGSVASTQYQRDPFMKFDLNGTKGVRTVVIVNQIGPNSTNLQNLSIFTTNSTVPAEWKSNKFRQDCNQDGRVFEGMGGGVYDCRRQIFGNYLVVQIIGTSYLQIAEAYAYEQKDLLIGKKTLIYPEQLVDLSDPQISDPDNLVTLDDYGRVAISTNYSDGTCIQSTQGVDGRDYPYWQADFGRIELVSEVLVFGRRDQNFGDLVPYEVRVGNSLQWQENKPCNGTSIIVPDIPVRCNLQGRYITVVNGRSKPLQICGITVNGGYFSSEQSGTSLESIGSKPEKSSISQYQSSGSEYSTSAELTEIPQIAANVSLNLLLGATVVMSTTLQDPACGPFLNCSGIRAVDGNANPNFTYGSVASTQFQRDPYMQFYLNGTKSIRTVVIINQNGQNASNLQNLSIFVTNTTIPYYWTSDAQRQDCFAEGHVYSGVGGGVYDCRKQIYGQYLVVQILGRSTLSIAEIYAYEDKDVLIGKNVTVYPGIYNGGTSTQKTDPKNVITQDKTGRIRISTNSSDGTCIQTKSGKNGRDYPYWQVDLGREELINEFLVIGRWDSTFSYMMPYQVRVGNDKLWSNNGQCNNSMIPIPDLPVRCNLKGRYVTVVNGHSTPLTFCGITVNGGFYTGEINGTSNVTAGGNATQRENSLGVESYVSQSAVYPAQNAITEVPQVDSNTTLNIALGAQVQMSSTLNDSSCPYGVCSGALAVDGNPNPVFEAGSVASTNNETNPYMAFNLNGTKGVRTVVIVNRNGNASANLKDLSIFVTNTSVSDNWSSVDHRQDCFAQNHVYKGIGGGVYDCRKPIYGGYLVVQIMGQSNLSLAEVYAFEQRDVANGKRTLVYPGQFSDPVDVTLASPTNLVTETKYGFIPVSSNYFDGTCFQTVDGANDTDYPFWEVDMGQTELVSEVLILNRRDANYANMMPYQIRIGNSTNWQLNAQCNNTMFVSPDFPVRCNIEGRYLQVVNGKSKALQFCGITINGGYVTGEYDAKSLESVGSFGIISNTISSSLSSSSSSQSGGSSGNGVNGGNGTSGANGGNGTNGANGGNGTNSSNGGNGGNTNGNGGSGTNGGNTNGNGGSGSNGENSNGNGGSGTNGGNTNGNGGSGSNSGNTNGNGGSGTNSGNSNGNGGSGSNSGNTNGNGGSGTNSGNSNGNGGSGSNSGNTNGNGGSGTNGGNSNGNGGSGTNGGNSNGNGGNGSNSGNTNGNGGSGTNSGNSNGNGGSGSNSGNTNGNGGSGTNSGNSNGNGGSGTNSGNSNGNGGSGSNSGNTNGNGGSGTNSGNSNGNGGSGYNSGNTNGNGGSGTNGGNSNGNGGSGTNGGNSNGNGGNGTNSGNSNGNGGSGTNSGNSNGNGGSGTNSGNSNGNGGSGTNGGNSNSNGGSGSNGGNSNGNGGSGTNGGNSNGNGGSGTNSGNSNGNGGSGTNGGNSNGNGGSGTNGGNSNSNGGSGSNGGNSNGNGGSGTNGSNSNGNGGNGTNGGNSNGNGSNGGNGESSLTNESNGSNASKGSSSQGNSGNSSSNSKSSSVESSEGDYNIIQAKGDWVWRGRNNEQNKQTGYEPGQWIWKRRTVGPGDYSSQFESGRVRLQVLGKM